MGEAFEALWLTTFMVCWAVFRRVREMVLCKSRCEQSMRMFLMMDYVVLYVVLFIFLWYLLISMYIHLGQYHWLDPEVLEAQFPGAIQAAGRMLKGLDNETEAGPNGTENASTSFFSPAANDSTSSTTSTTTSTWTSSPTPAPQPQTCATAGQRWNSIEEVLHELSVRPIPFARGAGIIAPWFVLITWCVCAHGTWRHAREIWLNSGVSRYHDLVIQIIALPVVYSLMALSAVLRMWRLMSNSFGSPDDDWFHTWETWYYKALQIYDADYAVADLYESWALHHFAVLAMAMLKQSFDSAKHVLERSAATVDTNSPMFQAWAGTLKGMHISVSNLAMLGIWSFVISCTCSSCYVLAAVTLAEASGEDSELGQMIRSNAEKMGFFTSGMGCVASSVAICNMIQIERTFHIELANFGPFLKFWGTKILVSIAFLQTIVFSIPVPPFRDMTTVQANVTYSTLICYECLVIALLHTYSWRPNEAWYNYSDQPQGGLDAPKPNGQDTSNGHGPAWHLPTSVLGRRASDDRSGLRDNRVDSGAAPANLDYA